MGLLSSSAKAYKAESGGDPDWPVFFMGLGGRAARDEVRHRFDFSAPRSSFRHRFN